MTILEKEILVAVTSKTMKRYEDLGYEIPKYKYKNGKSKVKRGTKILVRIEDISKGSSIKLTKICDFCGKFTPNQRYASILKSRNEKGEDCCYSCSTTKRVESFQKNIKYEKTLEFHAKTNNKEYLLYEFSDKNSKKPNEISYGSNYEFLWDCFKCGSDYNMPLCDRTSKKGNNCPYCSGKRVNHTNCLWTTNPEIAKLLKNKKRGNELTSKSNQKEIFICECGYESKPKAISVITNNGFSCPICNDNFPYPEKFVFNTLNQLNVEFEYQKIFNWADDKRYDFYLKDNNQIVIETHGIQHYSNKNHFERTLEEEQENDLLKEKLAIENGIKYYIVIDCKKSELEWIKNSIMKSTLSELFDLSNIDWLKCHEFACSSLVRKACNLWNAGIRSTIEIANVMNISRTSIIRYLKQGVKLEWCDYNPKEEMFKSALDNAKNNQKKIIQLTKDGDFIREWGSIKEISDALKISSVSISYACKGKSKTSCGYVWMYKEDYDKNKFNRNEHISHSKRIVVQLTTEGKFINEWESIADASRETDVNSNNISAACNRILKTSGGYVWVYKDEYEENNGEFKPLKNERFSEVVQLTIEGDIIGRFKSISEASKNTKVSIGNISATCNGRSKTAGGFRWLFSEEYNVNKIEQLKYETKTKEIVQLTLDNELVNKFDSVKEASELMATAQSNIYSNLNGYSKSAKGFRWMYKEDYENLIKEKSLVEV